MQNKKVKNIFSTIFITGFVSFLFLGYVFENSEITVKTKDYKTDDLLKENKYGLFLSSFHANISGDFPKLSSIYPDAITQNNDDFLGKQLILKSINSDKKDTLSLALKEYQKNKSNIIPVMYIANDYFLKGDYQKAYNIYSSMGEKSNTFIIKLLRSWILIAQNKNDDALDLLETELENPAFRKYVLIHLGVQAEISKDYDYADEIYTELLKYSDLNIFDIENISAFYLKQNNKTKAVEILNNYYNKKPDSISILSLLSRVKKNTYKPVSIDTANKGMAKALFDISFLLNSVFSSAQDLYLMYLSMINDLYPEFYMANIVQAEVYKKYSMTDKVYEYLDLIPENHYLYLISRINKIFYDFSVLKEEQKSLESFNNLVKKYPTYTHLYLKLGNYYQEVKKYDKALQNYEKVLSLTENKKLQAKVYFSIGRVYDELKDTEKARANLEKSHSLGNDSADFLNYYGYYLVYNNIDLEKGLLLISGAIIKEPSNPYYLDSYGWALFKNNDIDKALFTLEFAKSLQPKNPVIVNHLADIYWSLDRKREAVFEWKKALSLQKSFPQEELNLNEIEYKINFGL